MVSKKARKNERKTEVSKNTPTEFELGDTVVDIQRRVEMEESGRKLRGYRGRRERGRKGKESGRKLRGYRGRRERGRKGKGHRGMRQRRKGTCYRGRRNCKRSPRGQKEVRVIWSWRLQESVVLLIT